MHMQIHVFCYSYLRSWSFTMSTYYRLVAIFFLSVVSLSELDKLAANAIIIIGETLHFI